MNKSRMFIIFSLSIGILLGSHIKVCAMVDGYVIITKVGQVYQYNKDELIDSFLQSKEGLQALLYEDFKTKLDKGKFYSYHTDSGKYVSHKEVVDKYLKKEYDEDFSLDKEAESLSRMEISEQIYIVSEKDKNITIVLVKDKGANSDLKLQSSSESKDSKIAQLFITGVESISGFSNIAENRFIKTILKGENYNYNLPSSVTVKLSDGNKQRKNIVWNVDIINTNLPGSYNLEGSIREYTPKVIVEIKVKRILSNKLEVNVNIE